MTHLKQFVYSLMWIMSSPPAAILVVIIAAVVVVWYSIGWQTRSYLKDRKKMYKAAERDPFTVLIICEGQCDQAIAKIPNVKTDIRIASDWNRAELLVPISQWPTVKPRDVVDDSCPICGGKLHFELREESCEANTSQ